MLETQLDISTAYKSMFEMDEQTLQDSSHQHELRAVRTTYSSEDSLFADELLVAANGLSLLMSSAMRRVSEIVKHLTKQ